MNDATKKASRVVSLFEIFAGDTAGSLACSSLVLCLCSGIVLSFRFDPTRCFESVLEIATVIPFGEFIRAIHYFSAQFMLIALLVHLVQRIARKGYSTCNMSGWLKLVTLLSLLFLANLTGFILRGDVDAEAASVIFSRLLAHLPLVGRTVETLFYMPSRHPLVTLYFQHIFILSLLAAYLTWDHIHRFSDLFRSLIPVSTIILLISIILPVPVGYGADYAPSFRLGPWYFVGLQEMLRMMPLWLAGQMLPFLFLLLLSLIPLVCRRKVIYHIFLSLLAFSLFLYAVMTAIGYYRIIGST